MKLPDLNDEEAMIKRGQISALGKANREAREMLRDCAVRMQSVPAWDAQTIAEIAIQTRMCLEVLDAVAHRWQTMFPPRDA